MKKFSYNSVSLKLMLLSLLCVMSASLFTSCVGEDEPETSIGYYLSVRPRTAIYQRGGLPPGAKEYMIGNLTLQMKERIDEVYPIQNMEGNDAAVLMACDEVYDMYQQSGMQSNAMCVATLYRARMSGIVVKKSTPLKTYRF